MGQVSPRDRRTRSTAQPPTALDLGITGTKAVTKHSALHLRVARSCEQVAAKYLQQQNLRLLQINFRAEQRRELDLIMLDKNTLVFIEVKAQYYRSQVAAFERVNRAKQRQITLAASWYLSSNEWRELQLRLGLFGAEAVTAYRFDVVVVHYNFKPAVADKLRILACDWYANAFCAF